MKNSLSVLIAGLVLASYAYLIMINGNLKSIDKNLDLVNINLNTTIQRLDLLRITKFGNEKQIHYDQLMKEISEVEQSIKDNNIPVSGE